MFRKVVLGVVFAGLIGVLVFGAIHRTVARAGDDLARVERSGGAEGLRKGGEGGGEAGEPRGQGRNRRDAANLPDMARSGEFSGGVNGGNGRDGKGAGGNGSGGLAPDPQAEVGETVTLEGAVMSASADELALALSDGSQLVIDGRAWSYAQEQGFTALVGETLTLTGFYEDDAAFEIIAMQNQTSGAGVTLREASGRPGWAGRGRGGNNGH